MRKPTQLAFILATVVLAAITGTPQSARAQGKSAIPIILDCDIGTDIDDTFAVALALASPELDIVGITTVSGDTRARAMMVCRILTATARAKIPVALGTPEQPPQKLRGEQEQFVRVPPATRAVKPIAESAVAFMYRQLKARPGEITLVTVGPLSNIAELLAKHPDCKPWIKRIVLMGGSVRVGYNAKPPINPEFNIKADAKAARAVFSSGIPLTVAPLDATTMLKVNEARLARIFSAGSMLTGQVQSLFQLWNQKEPPVMYDPVAVTLCFTEQFCTMEDLHLSVDDKGFTREEPEPANARVATAIKMEEYLDWLADRFASSTPRVLSAEPARNLSTVIPQGKRPHRVHVFEDFETDIEKRWWLSGKLETVNVPPGSRRACRAVLTEDFDGKMGNINTMYSAVIFNPVPGPPMGKSPRLGFRYFLKGTDALRVQIYSLSNGYHRCLTLRGLSQGEWSAATVDMTAARKPDGTGGPLSENERIDDIQFYADPRAELLIDDIVLYDEAERDETEAFPKQFQFAGLFDTGKQGKEWPGTFAIASQKGFFWNAAQAVDDPAGGRSLRINLRGERPLGSATRLCFRHQVMGTDRVRVALVNTKSQATQSMEWTGFVSDRWSRTQLDFRDTSPKPTATPGGESPRGTVDEIHFVLPRGDLLIDDLLLYTPGEK